MCKLYLRFIHGKDATFENILTKNFAHERSKIVAQGRYGLGGVVLFKALNFGKDVCGLYGVKYARTFGCLNYIFYVHLSVLFSAQSVTQVLPCLSYPCCVFSLYINRPLPLKTFTQRSNYIAYILTCKMYTQSVQYLPAKWDQFLQV